MTTTTLLPTEPPKIVQIVPADGWWWITSWRTRHLVTRRRVAVFALHDDGSVVPLVAGDSYELEPAAVGAMDDGWLEHDTTLDHCNGWHPKNGDRPADVDDSGWCRICGAVVETAA